MPQNLFKKADKTASNNAKIEIEGTQLLTVHDQRSGKAQAISSNILNLELSRGQQLQKNRIAFCDLFMRWVKGDISEQEFHMKKFDLSVYFSSIFEKLHLEFESYIKLLDQNFLVSKKECHNITTTIGRTLFARLLSGDTTYTNIINYTALGDDNTAEIVGDATLGNETYRKALTSGIFTTTTMIAETFVPAGEATDTHEEFGMFVDGSAYPAINTGQMVNRWTETQAITYTQSLNVRSQFDFADA